MLKVLTRYGFRHISLDAYFFDQTAVEVECNAGLCQSLGIFQLV